MKVNGSPVDYINIFVQSNIYVDLAVYFCLTWDVMYNNNAMIFKGQMQNIACCLYFPLHSEYGNIKNPNPWVPLGTTS